MKLTTIFTIIAVVAGLGIMSTATIEIGIQQVSASSCNSFFDSNGNYIKQTGNDCNSFLTSPGTNNNHLQFKK